MMYKVNNNLNSIQEKKQFKYKEVLLFFLHFLVLKYKTAFFSIFILIINKMLLSFYPFLIKQILVLIEEEEVKVLFFIIKKIDINWIFFLLVIILLLQAFFEYISFYLNNKICQEIIQKVRQKMFEYVFKNPIFFLEKKDTGKLLNSLIYDTQSLNLLYTDGLSLVGDFILMLIVLGLSFYIEPFLSLVTFLMFFFLYFGLRFFTKKTKNNFIDVRKVLSNMSSYLYASIRATFLIQSLNIEKLIYKKFKKIHKDYIQRYLNLSHYFSSYFASIDFLGNFYILSLMITSLYLIKNHDMKIDNLLLFILYAPMIFQIVRSITDQYTTLQNSFVALYRVMNFFKIPIKNEDKKYKNLKKVSLKKTALKELEFKNVYFKYEKSSENILKNINFKIYQGEKVAFFGKTGSGKSTIIKLISHFYDVTQGNINYNGINIKNYDKESFNNLISYVFQEVYIFSSSIYNNIVLYDSEVSREKFEKVIQDLNLKPFIDNLKYKEETKIGDRGVPISFGQAQLIGLARVLIKPFKILILDEAFSNVDIISQRKIFQILKTYLKDKILILVTHNIKSLIYTDNIFFLENGIIKKELKTKDFFKIKEFQYYKNFNIKNDK